MKHWLQMTDEERESWLLRVEAAFLQVPFWRFDRSPSSGMDEEERTAANKALSILYSGLLLDALKKPSPKTRPQDGKGGAEALRAEAWGRAG